MENQVDGKIKEERSKKLIELSNKYEVEYLDKYIEKEVKVLFEQKDGKYIKGHTKNYIVVKSLGENLENKIEVVKIKERNNLELTGEILKQNCNKNVTKK